MKRDWSHLIARARDEKELFLGEGRSMFDRIEAGCARGDLRDQRLAA